MSGSQSRNGHRAAIAVGIDGRLLLGYVGSAPGCTCDGYTGLFH